MNRQTVPRQFWIGGEGRNGDRPEAARSFSWDCYFPGWLSHSNLAFEGCESTG